MIQKHIKGAFFQGISVLFLLVCIPEHVQSENNSEDLLLAYKKALNAFKEGDIPTGFSCIDTFFLNRPFDSLKFDIQDSQYANILNDWAFFGQKYYENQGKEYCKEPDKDAVYRDFMTFRFNVLGKSQEVLEYVIKLQPDRTVAYLNLADILFELQDGKKADGMYRQYKLLMVKAGKVKIPKRVDDPSARKQLVTCK
jgi:hypothetical protein